MKIQALGVFLSAALSVLALPKDPIAQYEGVKVLRVPTGADITPLENLVSSLNLERWTSQFSPYSHADVEVPKDKYDAFMNGVNSLMTEEQRRVGIVTMHENLAESIRLESEGMYTPQTG
jgi:hypothetical protein